MRWILIVLFFAQTYISMGQNITGMVLNDKGEALPATVTCSNFTEQCAVDGSYILRLRDIGTYTITASCASYKSQTAVLNILSVNSINTADFTLVSDQREIGLVTVSGSRFKKRAAEEVVSIEVIKPTFIRNASINRMDEALNKLPGVDVIDNQINIRGGSGWSYGAGSRVMIMVDDMPMLTADANDAKWDFLPIENCEQVEVMKGAASALYGSSALNGVVNFRTAFAGKKPITKMQLYSGLYGNPARKEMAWWGKAQPVFNGGYVSHSQNFGRLEAVFGTAWFLEDSYLQGDITRRARANMNLRYKPKANERILLALNANVQLGKSSTFFLHEADSTFKNLLRPYGGTADSSTTLNKNQGTRFNIDPIITYQAKNGISHSLRNRVFYSQNLIPEKKQTSTAYTLYNEYQAIKKFGATNSVIKNLNILTGVASTYGNVVGELYGNHEYHNIAPYAQVEKKYGKLWLLGGGRLESNWLSGKGRETKPVFRAGANFEPFFGTNIRASWGQGYRFPSIAERYVNTNFGAASVFPNPAIVSETGWSKEIGIKQAIAFNKWVGYIDLAAFRMRYYDMIEFNFGLNLPPDSPNATNFFDYIGFQSRNIGNTRITGIDASAFLLYNGTKFTHNIIFGITQINPVNINPDSLVLSNISTSENFLKYRYKYSGKFSIESNYKKWSIGSINVFNSPMVNIDEVFENNSTTKNFFGAVFQFGTGLPSTIRPYRQKYNNWIWVSDLRISYQVNKMARIALVTKNIFNTEYYLRPALINPPRNFTAQFQFTF
jgi:outer membrane receptor protein involved in Fe transport